MNRVGQYLLTLTERMAYCFGLVLLVCNSPSFGAEGDRGVKVVKEEPEVILKTLYDRSYAVVVGINEYAKGGSRISNLQYAVSDARSVSKQLTEMGFEVKLLLDKDATRDRIIETLADNIGRKAGMNDRIVFYFAGHGDTREKADHSLMGYILPYDYDVERHAVTSISMQQLRDISSEMKANHVLYAMDSCFSGGILTGRGPTIPMGMVGYDYLKSLIKSRAHVVIAAGGKDQTAKEEGGSGIFTRILLQALSQQTNMPWSQDGYVTAIDLASYIKKRVPALAPDQTPQYGHLDGEGDVVLQIFKPIDVPIAQDLKIDKSKPSRSRFSAPSF